MIPPLLASMATPAVGTASATNTFFQQFFLHPTGNLPALIFFGAVIVVAIVGILFLIKQVWDHYHPAPGATSPQEAPGSPDSLRA